MSKERAAQLIDAGLWLKLSGDLEGAMKLFERALKIDPGNERARGLLAGEEADAAPAVVGPAAFSPSGVANPFSRVETVTSPGEAPTADDWGMATGFGSPTPFKPPSILPTASGVAGAPAAPTSLFEASPSPEGAQRTPELNVSATDSPVATPIAPPAEYGGLTVTIGGAGLEPPNPIPMTPPVYSKSGSAIPQFTPPQFERQLGSSGVTAAPAIADRRGTVTLSGEAVPSAAPTSTPPLFGNTGERPIVSKPQEDDAFSISIEADEPEESPSKSGTKSSDSAWNWQAPAPQSSGALAGPAAPWPTGARFAEASPPSFKPQTAWDAKSNPGVTLGVVPGEGRALELVNTSPPLVAAPESPPSKGSPDEVRALLRGARDLLDLDDHSGAVELIMKAQSISPNDAEVKVLRERSEKTLLAMFESKLGNMNAVPRVLLKDDEIIWLNLDHRAGFVLAQIDGSVSFDDLFAVSGMARLDTARIIAQLIDEGVISRG